MLLYDTMDIEDEAVDMEVEDEAVDMSRLALQIHFLKSINLVV